MKRSGRVVRIAVVGLAVATVLPACGANAKGDAEKLRAAIRRTEGPAHAFIYKEATADRNVSVQGIVEDDYRYKARVMVGGVDVEDEVVSDDALAVRFVEPSAVDLFLAPAAATAADTAIVVGATATDSATAIANLRARRWVTDPAGAPELTAAVQKRQLGADPVLDALTVLSYVESSIGEAEKVSKYNPEALDYIASEDRFPKPTKGSGIERFDLRPRRILRPSQATPGSSLPQASNFRRMSVYVKDGIILKVLEDMDVLTSLDRLISAYSIKVPPGGSVQLRAARAIAAVNQQRKVQGNEPIRIRRMSLELLPAAKGQSVQLPTDTVEANLSLLRNRGRAANTAGAQAKVTSPNG